MKSIQSITVHSKQYIVGERCHPPGFRDEATVMKITEKNKFYGLIRGFVVHFDTKKELHIHTEPFYDYEASAVESHCFQS